MFEKYSRGSSKIYVLTATMTIVLCIALGLVFSLTSARTASTQEGSSSKYIRTCDGGKILLKDSEARSLELHNQERRERGLDYLCVNPDLTESSRKHSQDMMANDYFSHDSQNGDRAIDRMEDAGYSGWSTWGENLSWGSGSGSGPENQFQTLMDSQGHRENILRESFREIGIGNASGTFRGNQNAVVYTMNFGARRGQDHQFPREVSQDFSSGESGEQSSPGIYRNGVFYLKNDFSGGKADTKFRYGGTRSGTEPLMGDWNGDGTKTPGIARGNTFYLKNENGGGKADTKFRFGKASDEAVVGDWNGDGRDTVGTVRGNTFYLKNENGGGKADIKFRFGKASDEPVVGDWDGDGRDTVGIVRGNTFYLKNENGGGKADIKFRFGKASDEPVVGDWNGDETDTIGVVRNGSWLLSNSSGGGKADESFSYGGDDDTPLVW